MAEFVYIYAKEGDSQVNFSKETNAKNAGANRTIGVNSGAEFRSAFDDLKKANVKIKRLDIDSHGSPGVLDFRGDRVFFDTWARDFKGKGYEDLFEVNAHAWIYGCNIADVGTDPKLDGRKFLEQFALTFLSKSGGRVTGSTYVTATVPLLGTTIYLDKVHAIIKKGGASVRMVKGGELSDPAGVWRVREEGEDWWYNFLREDGQTVHYKDNSILFGKSGKGRWKMQPDVLRIDWESGSSEEWELPLYAGGQTGVWRKKDGGTAPLLATWQYPPSNRWTD